MPGCLSNKSIITREIKCGNTFITICATGVGGGMEVIINNLTLLILTYYIPLAIGVGLGGYVLYLVIKALKIYIKKNS